MPSLKFRILLDTVKEQEIFRDIIINDNDSLEALYKCIIDAFDFSDDQMASFYVSDQEWSKGEEISLMDMSFDEDGDAPLIMKDAIIKHYIESPKQRFILVYDFLNLWIFLIELQEVIAKKVKEPEVVLAVGAVSEEYRKKGNNPDDIQFQTDKLDNFDDFDDDYSEDDFENIDDFDI